MNEANQTPEDYVVSEYWSKVGREIDTRSQGNVVAGDDDAFYRHKRRKFLRKFLHTIDFDGKTVLEIGCGPGGNLAEVLKKHKPAKLIGVDISPVMIEIARRNIGNTELHVVDGTHLPFAERSIDLSYTATVLQHNTDGPSFCALIADICRVTRDTIVVMEDIGSSGVDGGRGKNWAGRRVDVYKEQFGQGGFSLADQIFLNVRASQRMETFSTKLLPKGHHEGEPIGFMASAFLNVTVPVATVLDPLFSMTTGLAKLVFKRAAN